VTQPPAQPPFPGPPPGQAGYPPGPPAGAAWGAPPQQQPMQQQPPMQPPMQPAQPPMPPAQPPMQPHVPGNVPQGPPPQQADPSGPPAHVAQAAHQRGLGAFTKTYSTPGALTGFLVFIGTVVAVALVEYLLIVNANQYLVGGIIFFAPIAAFVYMIKVLIKGGISVHLFTDGLVRCERSGLVPVHWQEVTHLKVHGAANRDDSDRSLVLAHGQAVRITNMVESNAELFGRLREIARERGWHNA
jgi:hypothetical protein